VATSACFSWMTRSHARHVPGCRRLGLRGTFGSPSPREGQQSCELNEAVRYLLHTNSIYINMLIKKLIIVM
jgi:hypothetical protein